MNRPGLHAFVIILFCIIGYSNTFDVPFHFDDNEYILQNPLIRDLRYFSEPSRVDSVMVFDSLVKYTFNTRFVGFLTFALNYRMNGTDVLGYHVVNLSVHVLNALLLYQLVQLLFRALSPYSCKPLFPGSGRQSISLTALFSALLFACHPLQTGAVTYISQRFASLAAMFYLLTVVAYLKARLEIQSAELVTEKSERGTSPVAFLWYAASLIFAVFAMKTKEISFTLPLVVAVCEFIFFSGSLRKRIYCLLPILLTLFIIPSSMMDIEKPIGDLLAGAGDVARAKTSISRMDYLFTQFSVIATYLRLFLLPVNQNFDYDYPLYQSFLHPEVYLSMIFLLAVLGLGLYSLYRSSPGVKGVTSSRSVRIAAFGIFWFFMTISVESSIIPTNDIIFEHRMYLPSAGIAIAFAVFIFESGKSIGKRIPFAENALFVAMSGVVVLFCLLTYVRNEVWRSGVTIWEDVIRKSPLKARGYNELGRVYYNHGINDKAAEAYERAIELQPDFAWAHNNLGLVYYKTGRTDDALEQIRRASELGLSSPEVCNNLGALYFKKGLVDEAIGYFLFALILDPNSASAHHNLGVAYETRGLSDKAAGHFEKAHLLSPDKY